MVWKVYYNKTAAVPVSRDSDVHRQLIYLNGKSIFSLSNIHGLTHTQAAWAIHDIHLQCLRLSPLVWQPRLNPQLLATDTKWQGARINQADPFTYHTHIHNQSGTDGTVKHTHVAGVRQAAAAGWVHLARPHSTTPSKCQALQPLPHHLHISHLPSLHHREQTSSPCH